MAAEAAALKQQIRDARKEMCDTNLMNETASIEAVKLTLRIRKTLRGHLSKVTQARFTGTNTILRNIAKMT